MSRRSNRASTTENFIHTSSLLTLRIAGLGHHFEIDISPTATLAELKSEIERRTELPSSYLRLVAKHKKTDDDSLVLGPTILEGGNIKDLGIGLEDRTKILLLHSPQYAADKEGVDKLVELLKEIAEVDEKRKTREFERIQVHELITQLCCKIDGVETNGSEALRALRKSTIRKAEEVAKKSDEAKRGIDP